MDSLQALSLSPDIRFKPMGANSARKLIKRGEALLPTQNNRLIHLDLTSDSCGKHLKFCPIIFSHFKSVHSIQLYLPYQEWLRRIQRRHELGRTVSECAQQLFELSEVNDQRARTMYRNIYARWENYLDNKRVHSRIVIDAQNDIVFRCHPKDVRRNLLRCVLSSTICRMPRLFCPIDSEPLDDGFGEAAAAHRINPGLHQSGHLIGDLLVGDGGAEAFG